LVEKKDWLHTIFCQSIQKAVLTLASPNSRLRLETGDEEPEKLDPAAGALYPKGRVLSETHPLCFKIRIVIETIHCFFMDWKIRKGVSIKRI